MEEAGGVFELNDDVDIQEGFQVELKVLWPLFSSANAY